jgi:hypothetical protein|tara:strand:- start:3172 stop:3507 length:336 start_codon:yes stop_codon:yes gene_type:complete
MKRYVRILTILMLAVFAAGSVVHTANSASMNTTMALTAFDNDMGDCQDCPDGSDNMLSCDYICVSPLSAILPSGESGLPAAVTITEKSVDRSMTGRTGLPNPYPPRSTILS